MLLLTAGLRLRNALTSFFVKKPSPFRSAPLTRERAYAKASSSRGDRPVPLPTSRAGGGRFGPRRAAADDIAPIDFLQLQKICNLKQREKQI